MILEGNGVGLVAGKQKYEQLVEIKLSLEMEISTYRSILEDEEKRIKRCNILRKLAKNLVKIKTLILHQFNKPVECLDNILLEGEPKVQQKPGKRGTWGGR